MPTAKAGAFFGLDQKAPLFCSWNQMKIVSLYCLFHSAGTKASSTDLDTLHYLGILINGTYLLKIGVPNLFSLVVGMTHIVTYNRSLATYFTKSGHIKTPLINQVAS